MANIKSMETLVKAVEKVTNDNLNEIVANSMVDVETLTDKEKLCVLVFAEMQKALTNKDHSLVLDCNYAASKKHSDEEDAEYLVNYFRLVPNTNPNTTLVQIKATHIDVANGKISFKLHTSCAKANRDQFEAMEKELKFKVKYDPKTHRAKTSTRLDVTYEELVDVVNSVCAVLANTATMVAEERAQKAQKAKEQKAKKVEAEPTVKAEKKSAKPRRRGSKQMQAAIA